MKKNIIIIFLIVILILETIILISLKTNNENKNDEVERKFLVDVSLLPKEFENSLKIEIVQTYINYSPEMRVRKIDDLYHYYTMKLPNDFIGLSRREIEVFITKEEYEVLLLKQVGNTIYKTRYQFNLGKYTYEVDIYEKDLSGLVVCEVEFKTVKEANKFSPPNFLIKDITSDKRYKNAFLSKDGLPKD